MNKINTIIVPIITYNYIDRFIETLYKHTPPNFYLFVIDQCQDHRVLPMDKVHFHLKSYRNLGFSKAHNQGILLSQTPYVTLANDDLEFMNKAWFQGVLDTFALDPAIIGVNPMSPKEGAWGYGLRSDNIETWVPPDEYVKGDDPEAVYPKKPDGTGFYHKNEFTQEDYSFLLNNHPRYTANSVVDAVTMWGTVFKKSGLEEIGLLDERFYPGGGEDYDMCARAYSCAFPHERETCDPSFHRRIVSTSKSWVWHHWGKSKKVRDENPSSPFFSRPAWNNNDELWPLGFDVWGHDTVNNVKIPYKRVKEIHVDEL